MNSIQIPVLSSCFSFLYLDANLSTQMLSNGRYFPAATFHSLAETAGKQNNCFDDSWSHISSLSHSSCDDELIGLSCLPACFFWLWFSINSVWKQVTVPILFHKGELQMTVHDQKEIVFSRGHMGFFWKSVCCPQSWCYWAPEYSSERDWKIMK